MQLADFDYPLPDELIARYPAATRRGSRLLHLDPASGSLHDRQFADLPALLEPGDLLVCNDTRVIPARLFGRKVSGGRFEMLIERQLSEFEALVHVKASKSPKAGSRLLFTADCSAAVLSRQGVLFRLRFDQPVAAVLEREGEVPLPPYLQRPADLADAERYQTVYAREPGAVAAPTAGLHFDAAMLEELRSKGIDLAFVTLHVGAGTFQNLREEQVEENRLHSERVQVSRAVCEAVNTARARGGRVIAVGTTTVRSLEVAASTGEVAPFDGETDLFIRPGFRFRAVDALLTNFHLPRSSLLMLVAAFAGTERTMLAYHHAVDARYRFFSYGDAMFISTRSDD